MEGQSNPRHDLVTCKTCGLAKSREMYYRHAKTRNGLTSWCKACCAEYNRAMYRLAHPTPRAPGRPRRDATP